MSYEREMLKRFRMPPREEVEEALLIALFEHNGTIKEFSSSEEIVSEIATKLNLSKEQRTAYLETIYRKENRIKKSGLWHRLLFRAADDLAKSKLVSRPTQTLKLTSKREWMLTEKGFDKAIELKKISETKKDKLFIKTYEVQKIVKKLKESERPKIYTPFDKNKKTSTTIKKAALRSRGFRQAIIEAYNYKCSFCNLQIYSPDTQSWEVQAAHIVPHNFKGKDDIWNGLALCHLHHWAFDVGWFSILDNYSIQVSTKAQLLPSGFGKMGTHELFQSRNSKTISLSLPNNIDFHPHPTALAWHRENIFHK